MWPHSVGRYRCTNCGCAQLGLRAVNPVTNDEAVLEGALVCGRCTATYPVSNGIPRFVPPENYSSSFGYQWQLHRRTQLDSYTGLPISRKRLFGVTGWPEELRGEQVLEAGSGAGRFTEVLLTTGATVFSFDYSSAADANYANNGRDPRLNLFQGDIFRIPLPEESFDKVLCLGVIQHTPEPEEAFHSLARQVRPGGELVIDVYTRSISALLQWKYLLRPLTRRMRKETLYGFVSRGVPLLLPLTGFLRRTAGRIGARLMPIVEYSHLGLPAELNREWAILDTFDMYAPVHDHPQSLAAVKRWFEEAGFEQIAVRYGPNGVVGKGRRPRP